MWVLQNTNVCICDILYLCLGVYILIGAGALMMVVGFLGCCGAIQESPCMLGLVCAIYLFFSYLSFLIQITSFDWHNIQTLFKKSSFFLSEA